MCLGMANGGKMSDKEKMMALINEIKAEAIKEFADRLKEITIDRYYQDLLFKEIDNLLEEMVGGNNG
jgi:DNA-directed RNA polymerase specialized sigma subunit